MATVLDIGLFQHFGGLFTFLLVLVLMYAILSKVLWKDEKKGIAALVAFILAFTTLMSPVAVKTITMMAPWFVLFVIFGFLMIIAFMSFGISEDTIKNVITKTHGGMFYNWVLGIMLIIGVGSLVTVINAETPVIGLQAGGNITGIEAGGAATGFWPTLFHPKLLGLVLILLVSYFTISHLSRKT